MTCACLLTVCERKWFPMLSKSIRMIYKLHLPQRLEETVLFPYLTGVWHIKYPDYVAHQNVLMKTSQFLKSLLSLILYALLCFQWCMLMDIFIKGIHCKACLRRKSPYISDCLLGMFRLSSSRFWPSKFESDCVRYVDSLPIQTRSWDLEWIISWW